MPKAVRGQPRAEKEHSSGSFEMFLDMQRFSNYISTILFYFFVVGSKISSRCRKWMNANEQGNID